MKNTDLIMGFQYYRAPTPDKTEWAKDLEKIASDGYNTVKYWIQWRWNEPEEGKFYFDDIDELMDLAEKNGLKVVLNIILDVSPIWLIKDYPESAMITANGVRAEGFATEYRQIGGVPGPCFNWEKGDLLKKRFISECVKRYALHPALLMWDVWNEPELSVGIYRDPQPETLLCYCDNCKKAFGKYLKEKYCHIDKFNGVWGRNYSDFSVAEPPKRRGTTADMIDWREFFCDVITRDFVKRVDCVKKYDKVHPVMCHTVPIPLFNSISCCSDDFSIAKYGDLVGNSVGSNPLAADMMKSVANGKRIINSEIHACYGSSLNGFRLPDTNDMIKHIFIPMAHGSKGFLFWQYRPEVIGNEAPAWGMVGLKGEETERNELLKSIYAEIEDKADVVENFVPASGEIAVYHDKANEIYCWEASFSTDLYVNSLTGAYEMFYKNNYAVDFISPDGLYEDIKKYKCVYFPSTFLFDEDKANAVFDYASAGGTVIIEALFGIENEKTGRHCYSIPGCGVAEKLGIKTENFYSSTMIENGYDGKVFTKADGDKVPFFAQNRLLSGAKYLVKTSLGGGKVLAKFESGAPGVISYKVGEGRFIVVNTLLSYGFKKYGGEDELSFIREIVGEPKSSARAKSELGLRFDFIEEGGRGFIVLDNSTDSDKRIITDAVASKILGNCEKTEDGFTVKAKGAAVIILG